MCGSQGLPWASEQGKDERLSLMLSPFWSFSRSSCALGVCPLVWTGRPCPWCACPRGLELPSELQHRLHLRHRIWAISPHPLCLWFVSIALILLRQTCCYLRTRVLLFFLLVSKWQWERWSNPLGPTPSRVPPEPHTQGCPWPKKAGQGHGPTLPPSLPGRSSHTKFPLKVTFLSQLNYTFIKQNTN